MLGGGSIIVNLSMDGCHENLMVRVASAHDDKRTNKDSHSCWCWSGTGADENHSAVSHMTSVRNNLFKAKTLDRVNVTMVSDELCAGGHGCHNGYHACNDGLACLRRCDGWHDCSHAWVHASPSVWRLGSIVCRRRE